MIEVLFGDSEAASMKAAKNTAVIGGVNGPTSVWMEGKKKPPEKLFAGWIEGTAEEVVCLGFMLDIGDINKPLDGSYRKELIYSLFSQNRYGGFPEWEDELKQVGDVYVNELQRLIRFLEDGEAIRIWYSDAPYSRCGFYSLCRMLLKYETEIHAVKLPEYAVREKRIISYSSWGEVSAEEFAGFLPCEKTLNREEVRMYAKLWSELSEENSLLRTVINGRVVGVPEDFYDFLLWKRITRKPTKEARVIGDILGCYQLGVGDWWYARRIDYHIQQGNIMIAEDSENKYARLICLAGDLNSLQLEKPEVL